MRLDLVAAVAAAAEAADGVAPLDEATWLELRGVGSRGSGDDGWVGGVTPEGFGLRHGSDLHLVVRPQDRGRGVGEALLSALTSYGGQLRAWSHGNHPAAARLAARHGFERVRDLWVMRRSMGDTLPDEGGDQRIRAWRSADRDELLRVNAAAFAHHPEQGALDEAGLAARMAEPWWDPAGLLVAVDAEGRMLGFHWTKQHDDRLGEVYVVGIDPAAQGRGLGRALTLAGLHHLGGRGVEEVLLYVESDNAPALATYGRLGFTHADADTHVMYVRG